MRDIGLHHPVSELAMPPIRADEADHAEAAVCPNHNSRFAHMNVMGKTYYCPAGGMYWRASARTDGFHTQLRWPRGM